MVTFGHGPSHAGDAEQEDRGTISRNARYGMLLFVAYLAFYGGFVFLNAFYSDVMDRVVLAGVNLAIIYGFGLILAAIVLAMIYGYLCRNPQSAIRNPNSSAPE